MTRPSHPPRFDHHSFSNDLLAAVNCDFALHSGDETQPCTWFLEHLPKLKHKSN
jgi:hypothetical protein